jgi:hypothetical protein
MLQKIETRGVFSQIWNYQSGSLIASLALDYPFRGYYDVAVCYQSQGWTILQSGAHPNDQAAGKLAYVEALMEKDWLQHGAVWYSMVDEDGQWLDGPVFRQSFKDRLRIAGGEPTTYRVQVLVTGFQPLGPADREQVQKFFEDAREMLARQLLDQMQRK